MSRSLSPLSCPAVACSTTPGVATCTLLHSPASGLAVRELPLPSPITFYLQSLLLSFFLFYFPPPTPAFFPSYHHD